MLFSFVLEQTTPDGLQFPLLQKFGTEPFPNLHISLPVPASLI